MSSRIAAFGEVLWDLLPEGPALGGAPFNFALRMSELDHDAYVISAVGDDELGDDTISAVEEMGLDTNYVQRRSEYPTGTVDIVFDEDGEPDYTIIPEVAYDHIAYTSELDDLADTVDCVCFGTLAQRSAQSRETLSAFLDRVETTGDAPFFADINLRKDCYGESTIRTSLERANILKTNEAEARMLSDLFGFKVDQLSGITHRLVAEWSLDYCVVTLGAHGSVCVSGEGGFHYSPGYDVDVVDPCGSGDAFAAGFLHEILKHQPIETACEFGNLLGAAVATQRSATQPVTSELLDRIAGASSARVFDPALAD